MEASDNDCGRRVPPLPSPLLQALRVHKGERELYLNISLNLNLT